MAAKARGGSMCAVSTCNNYSGKIKNKGIDISFHRFPKDPAVQKEWIRKCKRGDSFNPSKAYVCSNHFDSNDFVRDLKAELLGIKPIKRLLPGVVPSLNLSCNNSRLSISAIDRKNRMDAKLSKQNHDQIIAQLIGELSEQPLTQCHANPPTNKSTDYQNVSTDYEILYNNLQIENAILKSDNNKLKEESSLLKKSDTNYQVINETLRFQIKCLKKSVSEIKLILKDKEKKMSKEIKMLSQTKKKAIETTAKQYLSSIFSPNQMDIIMKKKKQVVWSEHEIYQAITLRCLSKRAYIYVKNELHYPLPGLSTLQRWALLVTRNGSRGGLNDDPAPLNTFSRLRMLLLGKSPDISSDLSTYDKNNKESVFLNVLKEVDITNDRSNNEALNTSNTHQEQLYYENEMTKDTIEYLTGWVANKYRLEYPELGSATTELANYCYDYVPPSWVNHLSYSGLIVPSSNLKTLIVRSERLFIKLTKAHIPKGRNIVKQLTTKIYNRMITDEKYKTVIRTYIKQRIIIRMKYFDQHLILLQNIKKSKMKSQRLNKLKNTIT